MQKQMTAVLLSLALSGCATTPPQAPEIIDIPEKQKVAPQVQPVDTKHKHKIVVARFTEIHEADEHTLPVDPAGQRAKQLLATRLADSRHFQLLEHTGLETYMDQDRLKTFNDETLGADYLITGSVAEYGERHRPMLDFFNSESTDQARSRINIRLIDTQTDQVIFDEHSVGEATTKIKNDRPLSNTHSNLLDDKALATAIEKLLPRLTETLLEKPWQTYILSEQQGYVLITGGAAQGIGMGDTFLVMPSHPLKKNNADEGNAKTRAEKEIATLRVVSQAGENENEISVCELVNGDLQGIDYSQVSVLAAQ